MVYVDLYGYMRQRIVDGKDPDPNTAGFDAATSWHVADGNYHLNDYGDWLISQAILDPTFGIPASTLTAWAAALK